MDINSKSEFIYFMQRACEDQSNDCYIELYNILLRFCFIKKIAFLVKKMFFFCPKKYVLSFRAFVCADCDFDGQVKMAIECNLLIRCCCFCFKGN